MSRVCKHRMLEAECPLCVAEVQAMADGKVTAEVVARLTNHQRRLLELILLGRR